MIEKFIAVCNENYEIGKFYNFSNRQIGEMHVGKSYKHINKMINQMLLDLLEEIKKSYILKKKVYDLLCALHNLPRVYLGKGKETLCRLEEAIEYSFDNMSFDLKKKYQNLWSLN